MAKPKKKQTPLPEASVPSVDEKIAAEEIVTEEGDISVQNAEAAVEIEASAAQEADAVTIAENAVENPAEESASDAPTEESVTDEPAADDTAAEATADVAEHKEEQPQKPQRKLPASVRETLGDVLDTCESVIVAMFTVLLVFTYLFSVAVVEGDSMLHTLHEGDRLLLVNFARPEVGDIVVLHSEYAYTFDENGALTEDEGLGKKIVKRLIAAENQTVDIDFASGIVYVDGVALEENYTTTLTTRDEGAFQYPITVPEGYVFVLGDNRSVSKDSRHPDVGLVPEDDIVGTVWLRVYPFTDFAAVE